MSPENIVLAVYLAAMVGAGGLFVALFRIRHRWRGAVLAGNVALLVAALAGLFSLGELWYRFFYDTTDAYHITKTSLRWTERHYRFNNLGVRDDTDYSVRRTGRPRITFFGDSFANGHGVEDPARRFVNEIREAHPDHEVHVFARDGLDTGPLLEWIERLLLAGYELETVVYAYTLNDISDLLVEWNRTAAELYAEPASFWVRHSFVVNTYYYRWRIGRDERLQGYFDNLLGAYEGELWKTQQSRLEELRDRVAKAGGRLHVVTFPFFEVRTDPRYREAHVKLDRFWRERHIPHLDLLETYDGMATPDLVVNRHDSHPNERAHTVAAQAIGSWLF